MNRHTIRGTLATTPLWGSDQHGRALTQLRIAITPQVQRLRRGERREDYIRIVIVHLLGSLPHRVPVGAPVTINNAAMTRPLAGRAAYSADVDAFTWR